MHRTAPALNSPFMDLNKRSILLRCPTQIDDMKNKNKQKQKPKNAKHAEASGISGRCFQPPRQNPSLNSCRGFVAKITPTRYIVEFSDVGHLATKNERQTPKKRQATWKTGTGRWPPWLGQRTRMTNHRKEERFFVPLFFLYDFHRNKRKFPKVRLITLTLTLKPYSRGAFRG